MRQHTIGIIDATAEFKHDDAGSICAPLLPFAGNFRLIDFMLSNFSNAHVKNVSLTLPERCHSLVSYIGGGEDWHYGKSHNGIQYFPSLSSAKEEWRQFLLGMAEKKPLVVLTTGTTVCNINLEDFLREHTDENRELTIVSHNKIPIGIYIISLELLLQLLNKRLGAESWISFIEGHIQNLSGVFADINGYGKDISSLQTYFQANMEILWPPRMKSLLFQKRTIYPKDIDHHPTVYGEHSKVVNSLVGQGCMIEGTIENSIIFPNCRVEKDVLIRNCIVMEDSIIQLGRFEQMIYSPSFTLNNMLAKGIS